MVVLKKKASGLCECGCGCKTRISQVTRKRNGHVKGQPFRFMDGHRKRGPVTQVVEKAVGTVFGKLTLLEAAGFRTTPRGAYVPMAKVRCACGTEKVVSWWDLKSGKTKTCGFNHPHYEDRSRSAFNMIYKHSYKGRALKAGLIFKLTEEQFRALTQQVCHYCGRSPSSVSSRGNKLRGTYKMGAQISTYVYNGLDRVNSRKGYTVKNVVPCCGICNHAKHTMTYTMFTAWLDTVANFRRKGECFR